MLRFWKSSGAPAGRLGILPGAFNPVTLAHLAMARAALDQYRLDEVLFLLPLAFPHKDFAGASFDQRLEMLQAALAREPRFTIGSTEQGLFLDIARSCRPVYGPAAEFFFLCGRDAAERIAGWDYGAGPAFAAQLDEFQLLVAPRGGAYQPPPELASRIHPLDLPSGTEACSSSGVREAAAAGRPWEHLVPPEVAAVIRRGALYR